MRVPNFFNQDTPDILSEDLQDGGPSACFSKHKSERLGVGSHECAPQLNASITQYWICSKTSTVRPGQRGSTWPPRSISSAHGTTKRAIAKGRSPWPASSRGA